MESLVAFALPCTADFDDGISTVIRCRGVGDLSNCGYWMEESGAWVPPPFCISLRPLETKTEGFFIVEATSTGNTVEENKF